MRPRAPSELKTFIAGNSASFENARFICILAMSYVHFHLDGGPATPIQVVIKILIADVLGRSSVPLLSVISGILLTHFYTTRQWGQGVRERAKTLLVPMVIWNALAIPLIGFHFDTIANDLFALTHAPRVMIHTAFLRDLFVLSVFTPALVRACRRAPVIFAALSVTYYLWNPSTPLLLRPQIYGFYVVGIYIAVWREVRLPAVPVMIGFAGVLLLELAMNPHNELYDLVIRRPICAAAFWIIAAHIRFLPRFGKAIFTFFMAHALMFYVAAWVYAKLGIDGYAYLALWLSTPPACFIAVLVFRRTWQEMHALLIQQRSGIP